VLLEEDEAVLLGAGHAGLVHACEDEGSVAESQLLGSAFDPSALRQ
jgi:hypothetical protein